MLRSGIDWLTGLRGRMSIALRSLVTFSWIVVLPQWAIARTDPADWTTAKQLAQQIQVSVPTLSESERMQFLAAFAALQARHDRLEGDEQNLLARLTAHQSALRAHAEDIDRYEKERASWQSKLAAHNSQCNRSFSNPSDVARCDQSGGRLANEQSALDAREAELARRTAELRARQAENTSLVAELDRNYAAWTKTVDNDFNAPLRAALARKIGTTTLRSTVKSFIKVVDLGSMSAEARPRAERAFAWFTNKNFSENPPTPSPDTKDFRLWSEMTVVAACRGDVLTSWRTSNLAHRGGTELKVLDAETSILEPLKVTPSAQGSTDRRSVEFSYAIRGRPNEAALSSFRMVRPRTCDYIWHRVHATVTCRDGTAQLATTLTGSRFPSHRAWTNNDARINVEQGPFSNLWECNPAAPELVK